MEAKVITVANAGSCTPYELRQELVKRGAFDIPEDQVSFRSLLQRMMVELIKDEEAAAARRLQEQEEAAAVKRELAKQDRERKKAEALERSKQRQADPAYLAARRVTAEEAKGPEVAEVSAAQEDEEQEDAEEEDAGQQRDPFRSYQPKGRNKIFHLQ